MSTTTSPEPVDLRESVRDFRDPRSTEAERQYVRDWWAEHGIRNQFQAMLRAAEIECERGDRECKPWHGHDCGRVSGDVDTAPEK